MKNLKCVCVCGGGVWSGGCGEFWEEGTETKGDSGCHHQSYITARGEEQVLSQGTEGRVRKEGATGEEFRWSSGQGSVWKADGRRGGNI